LHIQFYILKKGFFHIILFAILFQGCSTERNSGITRAYHNVTTRYNILFNARESFKRGVNRAERDIQYDYTQLLPLFLYGDEAIAQMVTADMEFAAQKATKAITLHSIKAKPRVGRQGMSPAQRRFYDKREFNKYMDECYLIIGKAHVFSGQYFLALQTFSFMETEFPDEESLYEARVWRAKALMLDNNIPEAGRVLNDLLDERDFPNNRALRAELYATVADWNIKQNRYADAINALEIAIENVRNKNSELRFRYVLAQLYMEVRNYDKASAMFQTVIRKNPPYEMSFNATINRATATRSGGAADTRDVKRQLTRMLRDAKNIDYHDQIYYALAEIELLEGNTELAIEYFQKSAQASTTNLPQKTKSYLTLGDLFYDRRDYVPAQAYYDSAMINMQPTFPGYIHISAKARNLNDLVRNLNTIHFQDSVQRIARMPEAERNRIIRSIISDLQLREQQEREAEALRLQQLQSNVGRRSNLPNQTSGTQWYFYNPVMVSQGLGEFEMRWGRRNLEDNWRRQNRGTAEMSMFGAVNENNGQAADARRIQDIYTPEYYLQYLPLTDSMMRASNRMIEESLYAAGYIYNNDFEEFALAAEQYESLIRRFPQSEYLVPAYYYLYQLYSKLNRSAETERYRNLLLTQAPESVFTKIILDPGYLDRLEQLKGESEQLYEQTYDLFERGEFQAVINLATNALERFPNDALTPMFAYLKALSTGRLAGTTEAMRDEMRKITDEFSGTEIATVAQNLIDIIDGEQPELRQIEQVERARTLYTYNEAETHYFVWLVNSRENLNQLEFDLLNYSLDYFIDYQFTYDRVSTDAQRVMLMTKGFPNFDRTQAYYQTFMYEPESKKNVLYEYTAFLISENNLAIMQENRNIDDYIEFFKNEYFRYNR